MADDGSVETGNPVANTPEQDAVAAAPDQAAVEVAPGATDWADSEYHDYIAGKGWGSADDVLKSYASLEKVYSSSDKMAAPIDGEDILSWDGWDRLGVPAESSSYSMRIPEGFENGYDQNLAADMRELFHEAKLTPEQAELLHDKFVERAMGTATTQMTNGQAEVDAWDKQLHEKYGNAYDERIAAGRRAVIEFGGEELANWLTETGAGNHPMLVDAFVEAGMKIGETGQFKEGRNANFGITPQDAKDEISALRANPALMDKSHAEYQKLNDRLTQLYEHAYPSDGQGSDIVVTIGQP
tara:strand:- start:326 stop:1219 length:894 start_codon:yes stop_codon:yes gene_type:complete